MVNKLTAEELVQMLCLVKHPEGGWFRETYRSEEIALANVLPGRFGGDRSFCTAIYFLLQSDDISAMHRIKSDEMWHFYGGAPLTVHTITPEGKYGFLKLGSNISAGETYQCVVPSGYWFGAEVSGEGYALVGCTVSPGFDFADFEMGGRDDLLKQFPEHSNIIRRLTRRLDATGGFDTHTSGSRKDAYAAEFHRQ